MRKIITSDVFKLARIIKKTDLKNVITEISASTKKTSVVVDKNDSEEVKKEKQELLNKQQESVGFEVVMTIFEACCTEELEKGLYDLLSDIVEKDIANQPLDDTLEDIKEIVAQNDIFTFFKQASRLMK